MYFLIIFFIIIKDNFIFILFHSSAADHLSSPSLVMDSPTGLVPILHIKVPINKLLLWDSLPGMEKPILLDFCSNSSLTKRAVLAPNPSSWKSVADICQDVAKCLKSNGPCGKRVIVDFFLPGTQIRIDIGNGKSRYCVSNIFFDLCHNIVERLFVDSSL